MVIRTLAGPTSRLATRLYSSFTAGSPPLVTGLAPLGLAFAWSRRRGSGLQALPGGRTPDISNARALLAAEIARARRYEQSLSIVVLQLGAEPRAPMILPFRRASEPAQTVRSASQQPTFEDLESMLRQALRENDVMTYEGDLERFVLALPHTDLGGAHVAAERLQTVAQDGAAMSLRSGAAAFPGDGFLLDDLVAAACEARPLRSGSLEA